MPEELTASPQTQADSKPSTEQASPASDSQAQAKRSRLQALKEQRSSAMQERDTLRQEVQQLKSTIEQLRTAPQQQSSSGDEPTLKDYQRLAYAEDTPESTRAHAIMKIIEAESSRVKQDVLNEFNEQLESRFSQVGRQQKLTGQIQQRYGSDALNPQSDLYQAADIFLSQQGVTADKASDAQILLAFSDAERYLNQVESQPNQPPPPEATSVEGESQNSAEQLAAQQKALQDGDIRSSLKYKLKRIGLGENQ